MTRTLLAGWSKVDITPTAPVSLWGQMLRRVSREVRGRLTATALALEGEPSASPPPGGFGHAVLVSCDLCGIDPRVQDAVRSALASRRGGPDPRAVVLCATHTHTAPYTAEDQSFLHGFGKYAPPNPVDEESMDPASSQSPEQYASLLVERLDRAVLEAWERRGPCRAGAAYAHAVVGHNRRMVYAGGEAVMYGSSARADFVGPEGGSDHGVEILWLWPEGAAEPDGVAVSLSCPSQVVEGRSYVSPDYWGEVRRELELRIHPRLQLLPLCGAAGDQSPRDLVRRNRGEPDMYSEPGLGEIGRRIADAVEGSLERAGGGASRVLPFAHRAAVLELPLRRVSEAEAAKALAEYRSILAGIGPDRKLTGGDMFRLFPPIGVLLRRDEQERRRSFPAEVHVLRLGDIAVATNPFELYLEYGLRMKARSPAAQTFLAQIAGGWGGYLPTERAVAGGGYGAVVASGTVGPEGGTMLVDGTIRLLAEAWKDS